MTKCWKETDILRQEENIRNIHIKSPIFCRMCKACFRFHLGVIALAKSALPSTELRALSTDTDKDHCCLGVSQPPIFLLQIGN